MNGQKHVLVTGASGVLGWRLVQYFRSRGWRVEGTFLKNQPSLENVRFLPLNLAEASQVRSLAEAARYDLVVHAAALTQPDECQKNPDACRRVNVEATQALAEHLPERVELIFISTDLVFDGTGSLYREEDEPDPVNRYGESKLQAERIVLSRSGSRVVRMAKIYAAGSPFHPCFVTWMKGRFERGEKVPLFHDQYRSPLYVGDMGRIVEGLFESESPHQLFHAGGPERLSRFELGELFAGALGYSGDQIDRISVHSLGLTPRGLDCSLDSSRLFEALGEKTTPARQGMELLKQDLEDQAPS